MGRDRAEITEFFTLAVTTLALAVGMTLMAEDAIATNTPMGNVLCTTVTWFTGNTGKGLATLAVLIIGVFRLQGKFSGRMTIVAIVGIAILFGAPILIDNMNAGANSNCLTS